MKKAGNWATDLPSSWPWPWACCWLCACRPSPSALRGPWCPGARTAWGSRDALSEQTISLSKQTGKLAFLDKQQRNWVFFRANWQVGLSGQTTKKLVFSEQTYKLDLLDRNKEVGLSEQTNKLDLLDKQQINWSFLSKQTSWTFLDRNREIGLSEQINKLDLLDKQQTSWCFWQTRNKQVLLNNNNNKNLIIYSRLRLSFQTCQHTCRPPCLHPRPRPGVKNNNKKCTIRTDDDWGCYVQLILTA